jgi:outer membrane protein TolC
LNYTSYKKGMNMTFRIYFIISIFIASISIVQAKQTLKLNSATEIALQKNPGLAQIQKRYEALKEVPSQVQSLPDPIVSIGAINFPTDTFNRAQEPMTNVQVGVTQAFPFPGKLDLRAEVAEFIATAASYSVEEARLTLSNHISNTWWQLYYLDRALETIANNKMLLRQFIQIAEQKYKTGKGLQQDVLLAQLELSKLTDQEIQVTALRRNQNINLNLLMGRDPSVDIRLGKSTKKRLSSKMNEKHLYNLAQEYRPTLKREESNVLAAGSRLDLAKKDYYPDFQVSVTYGDRNGYNAGNFDNPRSDLFSLKVGIKVPLYYKTKQSKAVQQKFIEQQGSYYALEDEKLNVMAEISKYYTNYQQANKQISLYKTGILPQARQTVESMRSGYQVNKVDFLNLVRSQITLFNYELLYWKSYAESMQALSSIQAKVGKVNIYE